MSERKTSAWPLGQAYVALIVYASLYPFEGWRIQGIEPWAFLWSPWPRYWTGFDVLANIAGYAPLGFLMALALLRRVRRSGERPYAKTAALAEWLEGTPFLEWLPVRDLELQPLVPGFELVCVALGALVPCLLAFSVMRSMGRRIGLAVCLVALGIGATALSTAMSWGPAHAWAWLSLPVRLGLAVGLALSLLATPLTGRVCISLAMLAVVVHLSLLNPAPASAYFAQTLQAWEQGRFIRFNGLAQWLGWLWPYAVVVYALLRVSRGEPREGGPTQGAT